MSSEFLKTQINWYNFVTCDIFQIFFTSFSKIIIPHLKRFLENFIDSLGSFVISDLLRV